MRIFAVVKIDEAIQRFADYITVERKLSPTTVRYYVRDVEEFGTYLASQLVHDLDELQAYDVRSWQMGLMEAGKAPGTVIKKMASLRAWLGYLRKERYLERDLMAQTSPLKTPTRRPVFFRENEVEHIYDNIYPDGYNGELHKLVLRMLYETGMRRSELANLTLAGTDLHNLTLKVCGKGDKERLIPIENELAHNISQYIALRNQKMAELATEEHPVEETPHLLVNGKGRPLSDNTIYRIVRHYMPALTHADRVSPHVFRHTFATHILNEGGDINAVKELLGHSSLAATNIYTHVSREKMKETYKHAHPRANKK